MGVCKFVYRLMEHSVLDQDIKAAGYTSFEMAMRESKPFHSIFLYRLRRQNKILYRVARIFCKCLETLELNVTSNNIGEGFVIWHGYSTVIYCRAIGKNVSINQNVTIGRGKMVDGSDIPIIEDNVKIFTGAVVIGGIRIGANAIIGANAVVTKDVLPGTIVAGVPAKVIGENK